MASENLLVADNVGLLVGERRILDCVNLVVRTGEIHALVGDHGSGKTTFAEILAGLESRFTGKLLFQDQILKAHNPSHAFALGIETIFQTPKLFSSLTVLDNIFPKRRFVKNFIFQDQSKMKEVAQEKLNKFSVKACLSSNITQCSANDQTLIYIIKSLCLPTKLLIVGDMVNSCG